MPKRNGLGKGLDALFSGTRKLENNQSEDTELKKKSKSEKDKQEAKDKSAVEDRIAMSEAASIAENSGSSFKADSEKDADEDAGVKAAKNKKKSDVKVKNRGSSPAKNKSFTEMSSDYAENADKTEEAAENTTGNTIKSDASEQEINGDLVQIMKISQVEPNRDQPRKYFDEEAIEELADSIRQFGVISPLLVQKKEDYFEIIAGERRWRAAQKAGLTEVPVIVREFSSQEAVEVSLIENIQREDLNPIEEAKAYNRLVAEYGLNQEEVAGRVSKSRSAVANSMRLLKLDGKIQKMLETGELSEGHARALIPLLDAEVQKKTAEQVLNKRLSVRQTERLVKGLLDPPDSKKKEADEEGKEKLRGLSETLKQSLGTKVSIHQNSKKHGKIEIEYSSEEELERLYELLKTVK